MAMSERLLANNAHLKRADLKPYWYEAHLINVSESINQVNYCRTPTLIPLNPALDDSQ